MNNDARGFTLVEILIALALFAIIVVGVLGVIAATNTAGLLEGVPTALATGRTAKDITAASTYLRGFQEYMAAAADASTTPGVSTFDPATATDILGYALPSAQPYQLGWSGMTVTVDPWYWVCGWEYYAPGGPTTDDQLLRVQATLSWVLKGVTRTVTVERFVPYRPAIGFPGSVCP
jgi:prepilin-type N-terminal cleavage/methylation domain-containing protein